MSTFRTILSATLAVALAGCGGGGSGTPSGPIGGGASGGGGTTGDAPCSLSSRKSWVLSQLQEWYLFPDLLDTSVAPAPYPTVQTYINALVAKANTENKDRGFTYITSIREENALIQSGANAGFGIRLAYDEVGRTLTVVEAFENAPAFAAGLDRGTRILAIDGQSVDGLFASGGDDAVFNALGPSDPGVTRSFTIQNPDGPERTVSVEKAEYSLSPLSQRYGAKIFVVGDKKVGYVNLRTFIVQAADAQLRAAFAQFQAQGVDQVILDLRYNGGGLIDIAKLLGDLMGADKVGSVFSQTVFRPSKSSFNETSLFRRQPEAIAANKIAVIGREGTASASELVTNSMLAYLGSNIGLIGTDTFGKPVGQSGFDRSECDDRLRAVTLKTANANGQGEYFTGLASVMQVTCRAEDDLNTPLGDPTEASIATALDYLAGRSCTPIAGQTAKGTTAQRGSQRELLMSRQPTAAQLQIPGLF